jgi:hypothetical protein
MIGSSARGIRRHFILTIINEKYARFGELLLGSLTAEVDRSLLAGVIVGDIGLSEASRAHLRQLCPDVVFLKSGQAVDGGHGAHGAGWFVAVMYKTAMLRHVLKAGYGPVVLLDADQFVCGDFLADLDPDPLISVVRRDHPYVRPDGQSLSYIASFMRFRDQEAIGFVEDWIRVMKRRIREGSPIPVETPALCELLDRQPAQWDFQQLPEAEYSSPNLFFEGTTRVVHFKSVRSREGSDFFAERIANLQGATPEISGRIQSMIDRITRLDTDLKAHRPIP